MNTYYFNDEVFSKTQAFRDYMSNNPSQGHLKVRAYAASQAIPISGLKVVVSAVIGGDTVIFYEGFTNDSGIIDNIVLPAPLLNSNNLDVPNRAVYDIVATYVPSNVKLLYKVNIYENVFVVQNINVVPDMGLQVGDY